MYHRFHISLAVQGAIVKLSGAFVIGSSPTSNFLFFAACWETRNRFVQAFTLEVVAEVAEELKAADDELLTIPSSIERMALVDELLTPPSLKV